MEYFQKVAKTAKLMGIKGSVAQREQLENILHAKFSKQLKDTFESQDFVTKEQVKGFLQELGENIKVKVKTATNPAMGNKFSHFKKIAKAKYLKLPFNQDGRIFKHEYEKVNSIHHEGEHYITEIVEPKYAAVLSQVKTLPPSLRVLQDEFYWTTLYQNESPNLNIVVDAKKQTKLYHNEAASLTLSNSAKSKKRTINIETRLTDFFKNNAVKTEQRIPILQGWRYQLKEELKGFTKAAIEEIEHKYQIEKLSERLKKGETLKFREEFDFSKKTTTYNSTAHKTLSQKISALKTFIEETKLASIQNVNDYFFFEPKIKILENELTQSLQIARMSNKRRINAIN